MNVASDWQVESLRITVFPEDNSQVSPSKLWDQHIGVEPEEVQIQRDRMDARHVEYANGVIFLVKQRDRIEWRYVAMQDEVQLPRIQTIGSLDSELDVIVELSNSWINSMHFVPIVRMAFGAVLLRPAENLEDSFGSLDRYLPFLNIENLTEFSYRVNRRRLSKVMPQIPINRIAQWSLARFRSLDIALDRAEVHMATAGESLASRLELDMNTLHGRTTPLPSKDLSLLFQELVGLALEISAEGDTL